MIETCPDCGGELDVTDSNEGTYADTHRLVCGADGCESAVDAVVLYYPDLSYESIQNVADGVCDDCSDPAAWTIDPLNEPVVRRCTTCLSSLRRITYVEETRDMRDG